MPCNYKNYPPNWFTEIRPRILERAKNCCEQCGVPNYEIILRGELNGIKVFQTDKLDGVAAVPCAESQRNGKHHGHQRKHAEANEVWRNEGIRDQRIAGRFF